MIRYAEIKDIEAINYIGKFVNNDFLKLFNIKTLLEEPYTKVFVFEEDNIIKGFLHITEVIETVDIVNIVVDPKYREQRIATYLIDYMLDDLSSEVKVITLEVAVDNESAIKLYDNFGFEIVNKRLGYYNGTDAYLMAKKVQGLK